MGSSWAGVRRGRCPARPWVPYGGRGARGRRRPCARAEQARLLARLWKMVPLGVCRTAGHPPTFLRALLCARPWRQVPCPSWRSRLASCRPSLGSGRQLLPTRRHAPPDARTPCYQIVGPQWWIPARSARSGFGAKRYPSTVGGGPRTDLGISWTRPRQKCAHPRNRQSEEHTSELQSLRHLVCRLLLDKNHHINNVKQPRLAASFFLSRVCVALDC